MVSLLEASSVGAGFYPQIGAGEGRLRTALTGQQLAGKHCEDRYRYGHSAEFQHGSSDLGLAVSPHSTDPHTGDGYIPINGDPGNDAQTVITSLEQYYPNRFGGVMGWDYSFDLSDDRGAWGSAVAGDYLPFSLVIERRIVDRQFYRWPSQRLRTGVGAFSRSARGPPRNTHRERRIVGDGLLRW